MIRVTVRVVIVRACVCVHKLLFFPILVTVLYLRSLFNSKTLRLSLTESRKLFFFFFKPHRQIFFKKSCFFVSIWGIEGVLDTGVWTLDRSRQYFSSKISIAKSL